MKDIYLNQVGYLPNRKKVASLLVPGRFVIINDKKEVVFEGETTEFGKDEASGDHVYLADFSKVTEPGIYQLKDASDQVSYHFKIDERVYDALEHDLIKALYFQRCGCALKKEHAGIYEHGCCHMGPTKILDNPKITKDMSGGWHDAGDYGRYVTPGAVAVSHILYAYLLFPESLKLHLNIPESGNGIPDPLNECRYELDWLLKTQREDGGVYHKVTALHHAKFVMPQEDLDDFYAYPVSSMATADFAACMALASRIYEPFDTAFAEKALEAAKKAYQWLWANPEFTGFKNPQGTGTGEYGDWSDLDERIWAACEMFIATEEEVYLSDIRNLQRQRMSLTSFGWGEVSGFASLCILTDPDKKAPKDIYDYFYKKVMEGAENLEKTVKESGYGLSVVPRGIGWGSNGVVGNHGMLFVLAGLLSGEEKYYDYALDQIHYLLGRNAVDYSYVTRHGEHAYEHPHNRPTESDGIELPMPGWVSGGANGRPCDEAAIQMLPKGTPPMKCFVDDFRSFSTNEITIYWNSPFVFVLAAFL